MPVGCNHTGEAGLDQLPPELLGLGTVAAEEGRRVDLELPAAICQLTGEARLGEHGLRPLGVCDHGAQADSLDVLREREQEIGGTGERHLHEDAVRPFEQVTARILVEQRASRRQLEAEA